MKCSICPSIAVWHDYASATTHTKPKLPAVSIHLCYSCLEAVGFTYESKALLPLLSKCTKCGSLFIRKNTNKCSSCWESYFSKQQEPQTIQQTPIINEQKLKQEVLFSWEK